VDDGFLPPIAARPEKAQLSRFLQLALPRHEIIGKTVLSVPASGSAFFGLASDL
jgi:hypothetical protein